MSHNTQSYDAIVVGGGLVGLAAAVGLAQLHLQVVVVERIALDAQALPDFDGRVSALSYATQNILSGLGVWPDIAPYGEPILNILVCEENIPSAAHFSHQDGGGVPMGHMVENRYTRMALAKAITQYKNIELIAPVEVESMKQSAAHASVSLADGRTLQGKLLVVADGKFSKLREQLGVQVKKWEYGQTAIVFTLEHSKPHNGLALERFFPAGPFAALPMQGGHKSAIVWTEPNAAAAAALTLPDAQFIAEVKARLGESYGEISNLTPRFSYPLILQQASSYAIGRAVLVGDTAHAVHPIAGQGVNLGYRDLAVLLELLREAAQLGLDVGAADVLARYNRTRKREAIVMLAATDGLNRLFSNHIWPIKVVRNLGLGIFERLAPLKRRAMQYAMGLASKNAPRLLKGERL